MKTLQVEIEDDMVEKLERVAPGRPQEQAKFVAAAIRQALWTVEERMTAEAYRRQPDSGEDAYVDPEVWS